MLFFVVAVLCVSVRLDITVVGKRNGKYVGEMRIVRMFEPGFVGIFGICGNVMLNVWGEMVIV